ncbi:MAG TPA: hypothetical protein VD884_05995 [Ohtaekwangia sp.]|nr:hypothetical protein [Ohtaekwangia sp.]
MINSLKRLIKDTIGHDVFMQKKWLKNNKFHNSEYEFGYTFQVQGKYVGIVLDLAQEHQFYIQACIDLKINYKVIDIRSADWIRKVEESGCSIFLIWPSIYKPIQKQFWDERLWALEQLMDKKVFPSYDLLWLYESKRKTRDWLTIKKLSHPETFVFFSKEDALQFIKTSKFPLVCKTDQGAAASGVYIIRNESQATRLVNKAFTRGLTLKNRSSNDRHQGYIIFQEYLPDCKEWRIIRVGDSYFCRLKLKKGDFHSGSGDIVWAKPPTHLLDMTREISQEFAVPNINVDYFETVDGRFLVNEIHSLWGGKVIHDAELEGRFLWNDATSTWHFEQGDFFRNRCANLRIEWIMQNWL